MEKKQVTIDNPTSISGLTLTSVTETLTYGWRNKGRPSFFGFKKPLYILISDGRAAIRAFTVTGKTTSLEQILSDYPELREAVKNALDHS